MIVLHDGIADAIVHNAIDREHWQRHLIGQLPDELRFYRCHPAASLGRDQVIQHELRTDYCARHNIPWIRRLTGGNTLYLDAQQLCWSQLVTLDHAISTETALEQHAQAVMNALHSLGIRDTVWHWPNSIETDGRRIATLFCIRQDASLLLQGALLLDIDIRTTLSVLRVPSEKLSADGLAAARDHIITIKELLGDIPAIDDICRQLSRTLCPDDANSHDIRNHDIHSRDQTAPTASADAHAEALHATQILDWRDKKPDNTVEAMWKTPGGLLRARAQFDAEGTICNQMEIGGDVHTHPADFLPHVSRALSGLPCHLLSIRLKEKYEAPAVETLGFGYQDLLHLLHTLLDKLSLRIQANLTNQTLDSLMLHNPKGQTAREILRDASVMLIPYCAKPNWCKWRNRDGCPECGKCEVGDAYRLARERHMQVFTIMRYEHLVATLKQLKAARTAAYIGMCCSNFFIKRHRAFEEAGIPALLLDISGSNCYELQQEELAYAGKFEAKAQLDIAALQQVIHFCPKPFIDHETQENPV